MNRAALLGSKQLSATNVLLQLDFDGLNGSTTFIDSGDNSFQVTTAGNAQISTAQSVLGGSSGLFDGNGDYLTIPDTPLFDIKAGNFRIELHIYPTANNYQFIVKREQMFGSYYGYSIRRRGNIDQKIDFNVGFVGSLLSSSTAPLNTWTKIAVIKEGVATTLYINDVQEDSNTNLDLNEYSENLQIGGTTHNAGECFAGYIDQLKIETW